MVYLQCCFSAVQQSDSVIRILMMAFMTHVRRCRIVVSICISLIVMLRIILAPVDHLYVPNCLLNQRGVKLQMKQINSSIDFGAVNQNPSFNWQIAENLVTS